MVLRGRDVLTGLPRAVEVSSVDLRVAIASPLSAIVALVRAVFDETPPDIVGDIMERGITLVGGGSLLPGLAQRLAVETRMPVHLADDPLICAVHGAGQMAAALDNPLYREIMEHLRPPNRQRVRSERG